MLARCRATPASLRTLIVGLALAMNACGSPEDGGKRGNGGKEREDAGSDAGPGGDAGADASATTATCADLQCDPLASCNDRDGDARCACMDGLMGDGLSCSDLDECADPTLNDCDVNSSCLNRPGTFSCRCEELAADGSCLDTDECQGDTNTCHPNAACTNQDDGFDCACQAGYSGDGRSCGDVDECAGTFTCASNADCINTRGGYNCECDPRYQGDGKTTCDDKCAALVTSTCGILGKRCALDPEGVASCTSCAAGFRDTGVGCALDGACSACGANTVCTAGPTCTCAAGFTGNPMTGCTDIDECAAATKPADCDDPTRDVCLNTPGGYVCDCQDGFVRNGGACVGVNECASGAALCDPNATCIDESPGYSCVCKQGFTGDGFACADVNECEAGTDNCLDDGTARCVNTRGSFRCACEHGYMGDGVSACSDVDECADPKLNDCDVHATCDNAQPAEQPLGYTCTCKDGFTGNGRECGLPDPCLDSTKNDCDPNAQCEATEDGFACSCGGGFVGDGKACRCDLSGRWAMRQDVTVSWNDRLFPGGVIVAVNGGSSQASVWELHEYVYDGTTIQVKKKGCGSDTTPDFVSDYFGETYSSYVPNGVFDTLGLVAGADIPLASMAAVPGAGFTTPMEAAVVGIDLSDPLNDPWPGAGAAGINWLDSDGDGQPGLTLWPRGTTKITRAGAPNTYDYVILGFDTDSKVNARASCTSVASRVITHMDVDIDSCTRLSGEVFNDKTQARVHSCLRVDKTKWTGQDVTCSAADWTAGPACSVNEVALLDSQDQQQEATATFELVRLGDVDDSSIDCQAVRDALPAISR